MATTLDITLLYLFAAVLAVVSFRYFKLPPMLGYLTVGLLIGPNALALAHDSASVRYLAEFGVVFLMFVIGLEFNRPKLASMRSLVFGLGLSQVLLTIFAAVLGNVACTWALHSLGVRWTITWPTAVVLGAALAMSSTAIVGRLMSERLELESEHGRRVMGILLFQDLAVVPLLILIPALGDLVRGDSSPMDLARELGLAALKGGVVLTLLLVGGPKMMRKWLMLVARRHSDELFVLNILLITLGLAWLTEHAGLSLALGAFIAGMLIAETEFKHQVETDIRPFHDVLLGLFFITIGMKLEARVLLDEWPKVLVFSTLPILFKMGLVTLLARLFGAGQGVALRTGLYLAQAGELGFVLLSLSSEHQLLPHTLESPVLAAMVISMLATPFIIMNSDALVLKLSASDWLMQSLNMTTIAQRGINTSAHIIICGFGRSGQNLARLLEQEGIPYFALDQDPDRVRQASAAGQPVVFGDATRLQSLLAAGLARAAAVVITYQDTPSALKILHSVRQRMPGIPVIVRTIDDADLEQLQAAGATEVVPEAIEGSLMLASHALVLMGVPMRRVIRMARDQRDARYGLLRGYFHGADDDTSEELHQARLHSVTVPPGANCIGKPLKSFRLGELPVQAVSVRGANGKVTPAADDLALDAGDTLVLSGAPEQLARAEKRLMEWK